MRLCRVESQTKSRHRLKPVATTSRDNFIKGPAALTLTPERPHPSPLRPTHSYSAWDTFSGPTCPTLTVLPPSTRVTVKPMGIDDGLDSEMCNAIFCDPHLIDMFLPGDCARLNDVLERLQHICGVPISQYLKVGCCSYLPQIRTLTASSVGHYRLVSAESYPNDLMLGLSSKRGYLVYLRAKVPAYKLLYLWILNTTTITQSIRTRKERMSNTFQRHWRIEMSHENCIFR
jgi:hypothetical protein